MTELRCRIWAKKTYQSSVYQPTAALGLTLPPSMFFTIKKHPFNKNRTLNNAVLSKRCFQHNRFVAQPPDGYFSVSVGSAPSAVCRGKKTACRYDSAGRTFFSFKLTAEALPRVLGKLQLQPLGRAFVELLQSGDISCSVDERMRIGRLQAAQRGNLVRKTVGEGMSRKIHFNVQRIFRQTVCPCSLCRREPDRGLQWHSGPVRPRSRPGTSCPRGARRTCTTPCPRYVPAFQAR